MRNVGTRVNCLLPWDVWLKNVEEAEKVVVARSDRVDLFCPEPWLAPLGRIGKKMVVW